MGRHPAAVGLLDDRPARCWATPLDHPVIAGRLRRPRRVHDRGRARPAARGVPVAGVGHRARGDRARRRRRRARRPGDASRAADWLLGEEVRVRGDWACGGRDLAPGGWAFEFANDNYPDIDDTAEVVLALRRVAHPEPVRVDAAIERGRRAGCSACSAATAAGPRSTSTTRAGCAAQLAVLRLRRGHRPAERRRHRARGRDARGLRGSRRRPRSRRAASTGCSPRRSPTARGSAAGARTTSTARAPSCPRSSRPGSRPTTRASGGRSGGSSRHQNPDGGLGEDLRSYRDRSWRGRGASTASQTAWALLALLAAGERGPTPRRAASRGWSSTQRADGSWDEPLVHGHRLPRRLLPQLPPLPARVPA